MNGEAEKVVKYYQKIEKIETMRIKKEKAARFWRP